MDSSDDYTPVEVDEFEEVDEQMEGGRRIRRRSRKNCGGKKRRTHRRKSRGGRRHKKSHRRHRR